MEIKERSVATMQPNPRTNFSPLEQSPAEEMRHFSALDEETTTKDTVMGCRGGVLALRALQRKLPLGGRETRDPEVGIHGGCRLSSPGLSLFPLLPPHGRCQAPPTEKRIKNISFLFDGDLCCFLFREVLFLLHRKPDGGWSQSICHFVWFLVEHEHLQ
jgi:hypothetical protein